MRRCGTFSAMPACCSLLMRKGRDIMVGGIVVGVVRNGYTSLINVRGTGSEHANELAIRVIEKRLDNGADVRIQVGDSIWWQGREAMWSPKSQVENRDPDDCGKKWDICLERIGYSH